VIWATVLAGSAACYLLKIAGYVVPERWLEIPAVRRATALIPVALLAALVGIWTFTSQSEVTVDARILGLATAVVALLLRAPFLVVIVSAAVVTALARALGWLP